MKVWISLILVTLGLVLYLSYRSDNDAQLLYAAKPPTPKPTSKPTNLSQYMKTSNQNVPTSGFKPPKASVIQNYLKKLNTNDTSGINKGYLKKLFDNGYLTANDSGKGNKFISRQGSDKHPVQGGANVNTNMGVGKASGKYTEPIKGWQKIPGTGTYIDSGSQTVWAKGKDDKFYGVEYTSQTVNGKTRFVDGNNKILPANVSAVITKTATQNKADAASAAQASGMAVDPAAKYTEQLKGWKPVPGTSGTYLDPSSQTLWAKGPNDKFYQVDYTNKPVNGKMQFTNNADGKPLPANVSAFIAKTTSGKRIIAAAEGAANASGMAVDRLPKYTEKLAGWKQVPGTSGTYLDPSSQTLWAKGPTNKFYQIEYSAAASGNSYVNTADGKPLPANVSAFITKTDAQQKAGAAGVPVNAIYAGSGGANSAQTITLPMGVKGVKPVNVAGFQGSTDSTGRLFDKSGNVMSSGQVAALPTSVQNALVSTAVNAVYSAGGAQTIYTGNLGSEYNKQFAIAQKFPVAAGGTNWFIQPGYRPGNKILFDNSGNVVNYTQTQQGYVTANGTLLPPSIQEAIAAPPKRVDV